MDKPNKRSSHWIIVAAIVLLLPFGYLLAYLASLEYIAYTIQPGGKSTADPVYRFSQEISETIFWPAWKLDQMIRPD